MYFYTPLKNKKKKDNNFFKLGTLNFPFDLYKFFLSLRKESFISQDIRNYFRVDFFYFASLESSFLRYKKNLRLEISGIHSGEII